MTDAHGAAPSGKWGEYPLFTGVFVRLACPQNQTKTGFAPTVSSLPMTYAELHKRSLQDRDAYWREQAQRIDWHRPFHKVCDTSQPPFTKWFVGGQLNLCHNAVDRHVPHRPDQPALIAVSSEANTERTLSYGQLYVEVQRMAAVLRNQGVGKGDRVLIYMPMIAEAVIAMLATVRLGAIHSVVMVHRGLAPAGMVKGRDVDYRTAREEVMDEVVPCVWVDANQPSYTLYTSGTTGKPKGVQRDTGGHAVALAASMEQLFCGKPGETFFCTSDIGWVVGHSSIVY